jgi:hypothetical protein
MVSNHRLSQTEAGLDPTPANEAEAMDIEPDPTIRDEPIPDWRIPYLKYLVRESLSADKIEARRIARRAKSFALIEGELYKRSATRVLQWCITIEEGIRLLEDIHGGICGHHAAPRTLVESAFRQSFYWPTTVADATEVVCTYEGC